MPLKVNIEPGEDIASIAYRSGLLPQQVLAVNPELRGARDPMVLAPGEQILVPQIFPGECAAETEKKHRYIVDRCVHLRLEFREEGSALSFQPYHLKFDVGPEKYGQTDRVGRIDVPISPVAQTADIWIGVAPSRRRYKILLGRLDPIDTTRGWQARLANLGFPPGPIDGTVHESTRTALRRFQLVANIEPTGDPDARTLARLLELHQS